MQKKFKPNPNSFKNTFCVFQEVPADVIVNLEVQFESKSGSSYYYTSEGMYRKSNHWGRLANSKWRLTALEPETPTKCKVGFANWNDFYPDNNSEKLYYIEVDFDKKTVLYQHKNNPNYDKKAVLRTTLETRKRIKQIRNLLELTSWAKYFEFDYLEFLRKKIIHELIFSETSLEDIKRNIQNE
ncbi:hypothetical protein [Flavobacterium agrisoli]|uniref:Uncharacterized protein n=1 Tax=Flavobacterium agrisoli TaxID=2793066 RepID=A0A934PIA0_9FLAO|nr:hypothetical protein [Flavobacterium agrisoli]MBK0368577.1 hypothetical protein [Flavobacterium agrisoli]